MQHTTERYNNIFIIVDKGLQTYFRISSDNGITKFQRKDECHIQKSKLFDFDS